MNTIQSPLAFSPQHNYGARIAQFNAAPQSSFMQPDFNWNPPQMPGATPLEVTQSSSLVQQLTHLVQKLVGIVSSLLGNTATQNPALMGLPEEVSFNSPFTRTSPTTMPALPENVVAPKTTKESLGTRLWNMFSLDKNLKKWGTKAIDWAADKAPDF